MVIRGRALDASFWVNLLVTGGLAGLGLGPSLARAAPPPDPTGPAATTDEGQPGQDSPVSPVSEPSAPAGPSQAELDALMRRLDALETEVEQLRAERDAAALETEGPEPAPAPPEPEPPFDTEEPHPVPVGSSTDGQRPPNFADGFHFGSYGRVVAAGDGRGRPPRDADVVAYGSRMDESTYAELELRREDYWKATGASTRVVATVALQHPIFHYNAEFDASIALRNLYLEEIDLGVKGLSFWAGSRMYRGDDIYVLNFWPLDNLNTMGGGAGYQFKGGSFIKVHAGINQPNNRFFRQMAARPLSFNQPGEASVAILDRQQIISSYKLGHLFHVGETGGVKLVAYGETHHIRPGSREIEGEYRQFEDVPAESGYVAGGELSLFTGQRSTHLNLWVRHAWDLAAYGEFANPTQLSANQTTTGARELIVALGGNYEVKFFGLMLGSYFRRFRNASPDLDIADLNEGIVLVRPQFWLGKVAGIALEASYQAQQRAAFPDLSGTANGPLFASLGRFGIMPYWTPAGRGAYARPQIRAWYMVTVRDDGAMAMYPQDDVYGMRRIDHLIGFGAEWWFGSTSYFRD